MIDSIFTPLIVPDPGFAAVPVLGAVVVAAGSEDEAAPVAPAPVDEKLNVSMVTLSLSAIARNSSSLSLR